MRLSLQPFRGRLPESVLQPRSILSGSLTEFHRRTDAQFQQMQQGMMAMFGIITQLYTHTGLAPQ